MQTISLDGPWASDFQKAFADAKTEWERDVLRDGVVTAAEYEQSRAHVRSCLGDAGYTISWDEQGGFALGAKSGTYPDDFFERSDPVLRQCESRWAGSIPFLFEQVRRNPAKKDEATIQVACLKAAGLVDETYSKQRWSRDNEKGDFPFDPTSESARQCSLDPLSLWLAK
ncbi:hypothetical protein DOE76_13320 [Leifsonia sp. ku-ls]|nr:hypothetical protein DOE76_13320 [Leifsonia sp. ku-ls]